MRSRFPRRRQGWCRFPRRRTPGPCRCPVELVVARAAERGGRRPCPPESRSSPRHRRRAVAPALLPKNGVVPRAAETSRSRQNCPGRGRPRSRHRHPGPMTSHAGPGQSASLRSVPPASPRPAPDQAEPRDGVGRGGGVAGRTISRNCGSGWRSGPGGRRRRRRPVAAVDNPLRQRAVGSTASIVSFPAPALDRVAPAPADQCVVAGSAGKHRARPCPIDAVVPATAVDRSPAGPPAIQSSPGPGRSRDRGRSPRSRRASLPGPPYIRSSPESPSIRSLPGRRAAGRRPFRPEAGRRRPAAKAVPGPRRPPEHVVAVPPSSRSRPVTVAQVSLPPERPNSRSAERPP